MNLTALQGRLQDRLATLPKLLVVRERNITREYKRITNLKGLEDADRDIATNIDAARRLINQFHKELGNGFLTHGTILQLVTTNQTSTAASLRTMLGQFQGLVQSTDTYLRQLERQLRRQANHTDAFKYEREIQAILSQLNDIFDDRYATDLKRLITNCAPHLQRIQGVNTMRHNDGWSEFHVLCKLYAGIIAYLTAVTALQVTPKDEDSKWCNNAREAIAFATTSGWTLQSASEAVLYRATHDTPDARRPQYTRTVAIYYNDSTTNERKNLYVAFDDDPTDNIFLARPEERLAQLKQQKAWIVSRNDPFIRRAIERASRAGRICELENIGVHSLLQGKHTSDPIIHAILSDKAAAANGAYLARYGHRNILITTLASWRYDDIRPGSVIVCNMMIGDELDRLTTDASVSAGDARRVRVTRW